MKSSKVLEKFVTGIVNLHADHQRLGELAIRQNEEIIRLKGELELALAQEKLDAAQRAEILAQSGLLKNG